MIRVVQNPDKKKEEGIELAFLLLFVQFVASISTYHISNKQQILGVTAQNALVSLIYHKIFKLTPATNKTFEQGQILNFVQADS